EISLDELLAGMARSMSGSKYFSGTASLKAFIISHGEFIYKQLIGLDTMLMEDDKEFEDIPALIALRDESKKFYIKINEDEIANDYPLPAYYKSSLHEAEESIIFYNDYDVYNIKDLPRSMLHNWALYNSDSRLISLELLLMKPCSEIDVIIYGSGQMTADDGSGFHLDKEEGQCSSASGAQATDGIPICLSAIKEWKIEFGSSMVFISIRTDMAWYRLGKPSKQYTPWYDTVLKTARIALSIIRFLKDQGCVSRLSFEDVIKKVSEYKQDHKSYISSDPVAVERYVVVHGQMILQLFAEFPDDKIRKSSF
ncbi:hypothetical protein TSUD_21920, partial [Trifolium subterraneum]